VTFERTSELGYRQNLVGKLYIHDSSLLHLHTYGWCRYGEMECEVRWSGTGQHRSGFPAKEVMFLTLLLYPSHAN
jgi:hypothetical protein